jgi:hypothetical protein
MYPDMFHGGPGKEKKDCMLNASRSAESNLGVFEARIIVVKLLRACGGCLGARRR